MKFLRSLLAAGLIVALSLLSGCIESPEVYDPYATLEADIKTIDNFLTQNGISAVKDLRGIRMDIDELGSGLPAMVSNKIKVIYSGHVLGTSTNFDEGTIDGLALKSLISGWQMALTTLPAGSKATVYVPSPLAYQDKERENIPANSILVFELDFIGVVQTETERLKLISDINAIDTYLADKNITDTTRDVTGIRYRFTQEGDFPIPTWYSPVKLKLDYKLLTDDTKIVFTQNLEPAVAYSSRVVDQINGLKAGLQKMKEGSKATFYIPSGLAFSTEGAANDQGVIVVPANANLIVEAELLDVVE